MEEERDSRPDRDPREDQGDAGEANVDEKGAENVFSDVEKNGEPAQETAPDWEKVAEDRYEQLIRLRADFENFRRRVDRDREDIVGRVTGALLADLLPVYDNLERALKYMPTEGDAKAWRVGVEMTLKGFDEALGRLGVSAIPSVGHPFDPRLHEAVQRVDSEQAEGIIVEEVLKGFQWKGQVLRASMVKVSTGRPLETENTENKE